MSARSIVSGLRPKVHQLETANGVLHIRGLSGAGRQRYMDISASNDGRVAPNIVAALAICEEDGALAFDADNPADLEELAQMEGSALDAVCMKLFEVSGLTKKADEDAEKK